MREDRQSTGRSRGSRSGSRNGARDNQGRRSGSGAQAGRGRHSRGGRSPGGRAGSGGASGGSHHKTSLRKKLSAGASSQESLVAVPASVPGIERFGPLRLLLIMLLVVFVVAALGAFSSPGTWYEALNKPAWNPPNWIFGPVWTLLYLMVAVAGWLIFSNAPNPLTRVLWGVQLAFNAAWSWLFFGQQIVGIALFDVLLMSATTLILIIALLRDVFPWSRLAAVLLVPYWLWISFATALNASIWFLN